MINRNAPFALVDQLVVDGQMTNKVIFTGTRAECDAEETRYYHTNKGKLEFFAITMAADSVPSSCWV